VELCLHTPRAFPFKLRAMVSVLPLSAEFPYRVFIVLTDVRTALLVEGLEFSLPHCVPNGSGAHLPMGTRSAFYDVKLPRVNPNHSFLSGTDG
jgi:hypothetical protein